MQNPYLNLIVTLWKNAQAWRHSIVAYYLAYIIAQFSLSLSPYAFGRTIDVLQHFSPERLSEVVFWLSISVLVLLIFWLFHGPARIKERNIALKVQQHLRVELYDKMTHLPLKWHQDHHSGDTISRINRATLAIYRFASNQFLYIETIIKFVVSLYFLLYVSLIIGILSFLTCSFALLSVLLFDKKLIPLYDQENEIDNHVGAVFFDYVSNMTTILTLRLAELTRHNIFQRMMSIWPFYKKDVLLNEVKWFTMGVSLTVLQSLILVIYIIYSLNIDHAVMIGTVVMIFRYQTELSEVFFNFSANYGDLVRMNADVQGLNPLLKDIDEHTQIVSDEKISPSWNTITIKNLCYHHPANNKKQSLLFDHLSFSMKRGEKIALIGTSGGGKSTLLNLIRGLYIPHQASLLLDEHSFTSLSPLHSITTLIPQDPEIFENTIAFNITLDVPVDPGIIQQAISLAELTPVIAALPEGLETNIREKGMNLSVGQKQRLALARGFFAARFSSVILLDEPTSSVDLPTEKKILSGVIQAFPDATVIVSLHRLHLLPKFDRILMLDQGKLIADGPTVELLSKPGPVKSLWESYQST